MEDRNEETFKRLIQQAGPEKPSPDFAEFVMFSIQPEAENERIAAVGLKNLLEQNAIETPSADFLLRTMSQVRIQQEAFARKSIVEPIISRRVWYLISAACLTLVAFLGYYYLSIGNLENTETRVMATDALFRDGHL